MSTKKNKPPLKLGMDFDEALHRFARTDMKEVEEKIRASKSTKPRQGEVKDSDTT